MAKTVSSSMYKAAKTARDIKILASGDPKKGKDQASGPIAFEVKRYGSDIINSTVLC
jgi:hypothetical protein